MNDAEKLRTITKATAAWPGVLRLTWSDGTQATLNLAEWFTGELESLRDPSVFEQVEIGDWGHSLVWPSGAEVSAETLWLETLSATGHSDTRHFLEWRLRHGLSLSKAADALGLSRRMIAYYSSGERPVPKAILLACRGWEVSGPAGQVWAA